MSGPAGVDGVPATLTAAVSELRRQLLRYRADRHPVEHATAQFHLGTVLLQAGRGDEAAHALAVAAALFDRHGRPVEHAKALNMLGAAHRDRRAIDDAAAAFVAAAELFRTHGLAAEEGAALHNLGLVRRDAGDERAAAARFAEALDRFAAVEAAAQESVAARELGTSLLQLGDAGAAVEHLERAERTADRAGDVAAVGVAANVRGLALLAAGRPVEAASAFERSAGAHPRAVRPDGYAMAKANLALAADASGRPHLARLAARQALQTPGAPEAVQRQAREVLARSGPADDDLHVVLDDEAPDRWAQHLRDEVVRWAAEPEDDRLADVAAWVDGQLRRPAGAYERAGAWVEVLLEQPPRVLEAVGRATVRVLADRDPGDREAFRATVRRATARFGVPQIVRFEETLDRLAAEVGSSWR